MAYVQVPKDLTKVKTKVLFNLTKRQLICFSLAGVTAIPAYFLTKGVLGTTLAACVLILVAMPFIFFAVYEKDGIHLEKILRNMYRQKFQRPKIRLYKTNNFYQRIQNEIKEKEVINHGAKAN